MNYDDMAPWMNSYNTVTEPGERESSYEEFKQEMTERLIKKLELSIPGISSMVESSYASTPITYRDYIGSPDGNMYGFQKDHNSYSSTYLNARTKIPNLFFTGQNLNLHGILGVTVSSFITCFELIDRMKLMKKVVES
jgi:all-trans-retinol 13,14-reductase